MDYVCIMHHHVPDTALSRPKCLPLPVKKYCYWYNILRYDRLHHVWCYFVAMCRVRGVVVAVWPVVSGRQCLFA